MCMTTAAELAKKLEKYGDMPVFLYRGDYGLKNLFGEEGDVVESDIVLNIYPENNDLTDGYHDFAKNEPDYSETLSIFSDDPKKAQKYVDMERKIYEEYKERSKGLTIVRGVVIG